MKFGLAFASSVGTDSQSALEICRRAEAAGFDSVWGGEHVIRPDRIESSYPYTPDGEMPGDAETSIPDPLIWLAYVGAIAPHDPYVVPQRYLDMYDLDDVPLPLSYGDELDDKPGIYQRLREMRFGQLSPREVREGIRHFWAFCTYLDDLFGQLLDALEQTGQA